MKKSGFPLKEIKNFSEEYLSKLAGLNITTAEEFISLTNTVDTREKVAQFLEVQPDELSRQPGYFPGGGYYSPNYYPYPPQPYYPEYGQGYPGYGGDYYPAEVCPCCGALIATNPIEDQ